MTSDQQPRPASEAAVRYIAELDPLIADATVAPVESWFISEPMEGGWRGFALLNPSPGLELHIGQAFGRALNFHLVPGMPVALGLWLSIGDPAIQSIAPIPKEDPAPEDPAPEDPAPKDPAAKDPAPKDPAPKEPAPDFFAIRTWPSMITELRPIQRTDGEGSSCAVHLTDPISFLANARICGIFKDCTPAELLGGALSLAVGGNGEPTREPTLPEMPVVRIRQQLRESLGRIPYAIASGETLGEWLLAIFGRLGVRMEILGWPNGVVGVTLLDDTKRRNLARLTVLPGGASASNAVIANMQQAAALHAESRDTLLDTLALGQVRRIGEHAADGTAGASDYQAPSQDHPVEAVLYAAGLGLDEAAFRSRFNQDLSFLEKTTSLAITGQPGLHPGRIIELTNRGISGAESWQVGDIVHGSADGHYRNMSELLKLGKAWRPPQLEDSGPLTVSAVVDDGESKAGAPVQRDPMGRIPLSFVFQPTRRDPDVAENEPKEKKEPAAKKDSSGGTTDTADTGDTDTGDTDTGDIVYQRLSLPVVDPMAGGIHGFIPAHRQGDVCRVAVHQPMFAEVVGFVYSDDRSIDEDLRDASMGVIAKNAEDQWQGFLFRPKDKVAKEEEAAAEKWRRDNSFISGGGDSSEDPKDPPDKEEDPPEGNSDP